MARQKPLNNQNAFLMISANQNASHPGAVKVLGNIFTAEERVSTRFPIFSSSAVISFGSYCLLCLCLFSRSSIEIFESIVLSSKSLFKSFTNVLTGRFLVLSCLFIVYQRGVSEDRNGVSRYWVLLKLQFILTGLNLYEISQIYIYNFTNVRLDQWSVWPYR